MKIMTREEAAAFAQSIIPDGAFEYAEAERWCAFLNYMTDSQTYIPYQCPDPNECFFGWWFIPLDSKGK
jgi:hypothetical protein